MTFAPPPQYPRYPSRHTSFSPSCQNFATIAMKYEKFFALLLLLFLLLLFSCSNGTFASLGACVCVRARVCVCVCVCACVSAFNSQNTGRITQATMTSTLAAHMCLCLHTHMCVCVCVFACVQTLRMSSTNWTAVQLHTLAAQLTEPTETNSRKKSTQIDNNNNIHILSKQLVNNNLVYFFFLNFLFFILYVLLLILFLFWCAVGDCKSLHTRSTGSKVYTQQLPQAGLAMLSVQRALLLSFALSRSPILPLSHSSI